MYYIAQNGEVYNTTLFFPQISATSQTSSYSGAHRAPGFRPLLMQLPKEGGDEAWFGVCRWDYFEKLFGTQHKLQREPSLQCILSSVMKTPHILWQM